MEYVILMHGMVSLSVRLLEDGIIFILTDRSDGGQVTEMYNTYSAAFAEYEKRING